MHKRQTKCDHFYLFWPQAVKMTAQTLPQLNWYIFMRSILVAWRLSLSLSKVKLKSIYKLHLLTVQGSAAEQSSPASTRGGSGWSVHDKKWAFSLPPWQIFKCNLFFSFKDILTQSWEIIEFGIWRSKSPLTAFLVCLKFLPFKCWGRTVKSWFRCMNKNSIWITVFKQNCLHIFKSYFFSFPLYLLYLFIHSLPTETQLSSSAVPLLGLMNDLAGGGGCCCGGWAGGAQRGEETLFLSPPSYYSHSLGSTTTHSSQEQDGISLLDYLLEWLPGPG